MWRERRRIYEADQTCLNRAATIAEIEKIYRICVERGMTFNGIKVKMMISRRGVASQPWCAKIIRDMKDGTRNVSARDASLEAA